MVKNDRGGRITEHEPYTPSVPTVSPFTAIGCEIGKLVTEKNLAYGDSFSKSCKILEVLYPNGIMPHQYRDALAITRVIDKMFRIATDKDALGESPYRDICGYAILGIWNDENEQ